MAVVVPDYRRKENNPAEVGMDVCPRVPWLNSTFYVQGDYVGGEGDGAAEVNRRETHEAEVSVGVKVIVGGEELLEHRASLVESDYSLDCDDYEIFLRTRAAWSWTHRSNRQKPSR